MAVDATPNFRVNVYGNDPTRLADMEREMRNPNGGGFPWFRNRPTPTSPYNPSAPGPTPPPGEEAPYEEQGPPDNRPNNGAPAAAAGLLGGLGAKDLMGLLAALAGTVGALKSNPTNSNGLSSSTNDPAMTELIQMMQGRLRKSEPMFDSVQAMTNGLLPTQYQNGGRGAGG